MNEREIIKGCLENHRESQKNLYENYYAKMMNVCLRYSNNDKNAHEMLQEGFLRVFKNLKHLKDDESLELWIKRNMIEAAIEHIRSDKEQRLIVSTVHENKGVSKGKPVELSDDEIIEKIQNNDILKAVQELTSGYRIAFNLLLIDGFTPKVASEILNISEDTLKSNYEKARFTFRKNLIKSVGN